MYRQRDGTTDDQTYRQSKRHIDRQGASQIDKGHTTDRKIYTNDSDRHTDGQNAETTLQHEGASLISKIPLSL